MSKERFKLGEQKITLKNIKLLYESQEAVFKFLMIILQFYVRLTQSKIWKKTQNINS